MLHPGPGAAPAGPAVPGPGGGEAGEGEAGEGEVGGGDAGSGAGGPSATSGVVGWLGDCGPESMYRTSKLAGPRYARAVAERLGACQRAAAVTWYSSPEARSVR